MLNNSASGGSAADWVVAEKRISKQGAHDVRLNEDDVDAVRLNDDDLEDEAGIQWNSGVNWEKYKGTQSRLCLWGS